MSQYMKTIPPEQEDEIHSLSSHGGISISSGAGIYERQSRKENNRDSANKLCVGFLMGLFLLGVVIFTYRYLQLTQQSEKSPYNRDELQANMQNFENFHDLSNDQQPKTQQQHQIDQIYKQVDIELQKEHNPLKQPVIDQNGNQLHVAQESIQNIQSQNSREYTEKVQPTVLDEGFIEDITTNDDEQDQQIETDSVLDKQLSNANLIEETPLLNEKIDKIGGNSVEEVQLINDKVDTIGVKSVEEVQLINDKVVMNDEEKLKQISQIKALKEQLQLHKNINQNYESQPTIVQNQHPDNAQQEAQSNIENIPLVQQIPESIEIKKTVNENQQQKTDLEKVLEQKKIENQVPEIKQIKQTQLSTGTATTKQFQQLPKLHTACGQKPFSDYVITEKDLSDPIIRVMDNIEKKWKSKFDDLIYIKEGTNITENQYCNARQRMHLWKYFNPMTGALQLLDEVTYEENIKSTPQAVQLQLQRVQKVILQEQLQYEKKYQVSHYNEIPFCIIIPSYKNQDKYLRNLNSILQQDYQNYHIIYIDDASHDGTAEKVQAYIDKYQIPESRLKFIANKVNKKALPNIDFAARRLCNSGEIMAIIDGDDYLIGTQVFKVINARYQKENLLMLYTNHLRIHQPIYLKVGTCIDYPQRVKKTRSFRRFSIFPASHLRTFFVDLYWRITLRDLKDYRGGYFEAANDFAIMMPIIQMAGQRYEYLPQLTYLYDADTGLNNFITKSKKQAENFKITKRRHKYPKLQHQLEFEKVLRAKGLMKPLYQKHVSNIMEESPGTKLRRSVERK